MPREEEIGEDTSLFAFICDKLAALPMTDVPAPGGAELGRKQLEAAASQPGGSSTAPGHAEPGATAGGIGLGHMALSWPNSCEVLSQHPHTEDFLLWRALEIKLLTQIVPEGFLCVLHILEMSSDLCYLARVKDTFLLQVSWFPSCFPI